MGGLITAIRTPRFILRPLTLEDVTQRYCEWFNDPDVVAQISSASEMRQLERLQAYVSSRINRDDVLFIGIFDCSNKKHVGNIKFEPIDFVNRFAVMGIMIGEAEYRGVGAAAETLTACAKWLREGLGLTCIVLTVKPDHARAVRAYESAGFRVGVPHFFKPDPGIITMYKYLE